MDTVLNQPRTEGHEMKSVYIFVAILAISVAESNENLDDLVAMETLELKKEPSDLIPAASTYNFAPPNQQPQQWYQPQNYVPPQTWTPPKVDSIQPIHTHVPGPVNPPYVPPIAARPPYPPVQSDYVPQNNYNQYPQNNWNTPVYQPPTSTTPTSVIKNEQQYWPNGAYRYEYKLADGTHVGEEGYYSDPKNTEESLVKKGWYSYKGADNKQYTVTWWADHTGYHAFGDHLPKPPPVPAAIQAALDKEEAEKNKPTVRPPIYYPPQQTYYPPQQTYYPPQQSGYGK